MDDGGTYAGTTETMQLRIEGLQLQGSGPELGVSRRESDSTLNKRAAFRSSR